MYSTATCRTVFTPNLPALGKKEKEEDNPLKKCTNILKVIEASSSAVLRVNNHKYNRMLPRKEKKGEEVGETHLAKRIKWMIYGTNTLLLERRNPYIKFVSILSTKNCAPEPFCLQNKFFNLLFAQKVVIPVFFKKNLIIRTPFPCELEQIVLENALYYEPTESTDELIESGGVSVCSNRTTYMLVLHANSDNALLHAAVQYSLLSEEEYCEIESIVVRKNYRGQGYGYLLFMCAALNAFEKKYSYMLLASSEEALPFYERIGFIPSLDQDMTQWKSMSKTERIEILQKCMYLFYDLEEEENIVHLQQFIV